MLLTQSSTSSAPFIVLSAIDLHRVRGAGGPYTNRDLDQGNAFYAQSLAERNTAARADLEAYAFSHTREGNQRWKREGRPGWINIEPAITRLDDPRMLAMQ